MKKKVVARKGMQSEFSLPFLSIEEGRKQWLQKLRKFRDGGAKEGLIHNLCGGCFTSWFAKSKQWMTKGEFQDNMYCFQYVHGSRDAIADFMYREGIHLIFMDMMIVPRAKAQECITYWENEYHNQGVVHYAKRVDERSFVSFGRYNL